MKIVGRIANFDVQVRGPSNPLRYSMSGEEYIEQPPTAEVTIRVAADYFDVAGAGKLIGYPFYFSTEGGALVGLPSDALIEGGGEIDKLKQQLKEANEQLAAAKKTLDEGLVDCQKRLDKYRDILMAMGYFEKEDKPDFSLLEVE